MMKITDRGCVSLYYGKDDACIYPLQFLRDSIIEK